MANIINFAFAKQQREYAQVVKGYEDAAQAQRDRAEDLRIESAAAAVVAIMTGDKKAAEDALQYRKQADRAQAAAKDHERAAEKARENAKPQELTPEQFAAILAYEAGKDQPTQNADGVRVGDLFVESFGYDMTINHFYQVVGLKGKRTAIVRRVASSITSGDGYSGSERAVRDAFLDGETFERRTSLDTDGKPLISVPSSTRGRHMWLTTDFEEHGYNTLD